MASQLVRFVTPSSRATVDTTSIFDSATAVESVVIVDGADIRKYQSGGKSAFYVVSNLTNTRFLMRILDQGNGTLFFQFRYRNASGGASVINQFGDNTAISYDEFFAGRRYAFIGGHTGTQKYIQIAEVDEYGNYSFVANPTPQASTDFLSALSDSVLYVAPNTGDDVDIGNIDTSAAPINYYGLAFSSGASVDGPRSSAQDCFTLDRTRHKIVYEFNAGTGSNVTDSVSNLTLTPGGTLGTDWRWMGRNAQYSLTTGPANFGFLSGATTANNVGVLHSSTNNRNANDNPIISFGTTHPNALNLWDDFWQFLQITTSGYTDFYDPVINPTGGMFAAARDDLGTNGAQVLGTLQNFLQVEVGNSVDLRGQWQVNGSTISANPAVAIDPKTDGDFLMRFEGTSDGTAYILARRLGTGGGTVDRDWLVLSTVTGFSQANLSNLGFRVQSKWHGGGASQFAGGEYTGTDSWNIASGWIPQVAGAPQVVQMPVVGLTFRGACGTRHIANPEVIGLSASVQTPTVFQNPPSGSTSTITLLVPVIDLTSSVTVNPATSNYSLAVGVVSNTLSVLTPTVSTSTVGFSDFGWFQMAEISKTWTEIVD